MVFPTWKNSPSEPPGSSRNNREVVSNSGDRVIIRDQNGELEVLRDDDTLLRRPGSDVKTETFSDGSTRTTVTRRNGSKIVTIADASGRVIKRTRITVGNREILLIDDTEEVRPAPTGNRWRRLCARNRVTPSTGALLCARFVNTARCVT